VPNLTHDSFLRLREPFATVDERPRWKVIRDCLESSGSYLYNLAGAFRRDAHPMTAVADALDAWANLFGLERLPAEADAALRARVQAAYQARFSPPTILAVQNAIVAAIGGGVPADYPVYEWWRDPWGTDDDAPATFGPFGLVTSTVVVPHGLAEADLDDVRNAIEATSGERYYVCEEVLWPQYGLAADGGVPTASSTAAGYAVAALNDGALGTWGVPATFWRANVALAGQWCRLTAPAGEWWYVTGVGVQRQNAAGEKRLKTGQLTFSGGETWDLTNWPPDEAVGPPVGALHRLAIPGIWTTSVRLTLNDWWNPADPANTAIGELELYGRSYRMLKRLIP
jgi:hypothetical protein